MAPASFRGSFVKFWDCCLTRLKGPEMDTPLSNRSPSAEAHRRLPAARVCALVIGVALSLGVLVTSKAAAAGCDPALLCSGDPCVVVGSYLLDSDCSLDFSGRDVVVSPGSQIVSPGYVLTIWARNLALQGVLKVASGNGGGFYLSIEENLDFVAPPRGAEIIDSAR